MIDKDIYGQLVTQLIRVRYTLSDELALLRQRGRKTARFRAYDAFCEACKAQAKREMQEGQKDGNED